MLELTHEECRKLERRVAKSMVFLNSAGTEDSLASVVARVATRATISTIREDEKMLAEKQARQQCVE